jgi:hypothetical protein
VIDHVVGLRLHLELGGAADALRIIEELQLHPLVVRDRFGQPQILLRARSTGAATRKQQDRDDRDQAEQLRSHHLDPRPRLRSRGRRRRVDRAVPSD